MEGVLCNKWLHSEDRHSTNLFHCHVPQSLCLCVNTLLNCDECISVQRALFLANTSVNGLLENSGGHFKLNLRQIEAFLICNTYNPFGNGLQFKRSLRKHQLLLKYRFLTRFFDKFADTVF